MQKRKDSKGRALKDGESQRKDGLYQYRWSVRGKRYVTYASTLTKLRQKESEIIRDRMDNIDTYKSDMTLDELYNYWKKTKTYNKEMTFQTYCFVYDHRIAPILGNIRINDIKRSTVKMFYLNMIDKYSVNTVNNVQSVLHQILQLAVDDDMIRKNPSDKLFAEIKRHMKQPAPKEALTRDETALFIDIVENNHKFGNSKPLLFVLVETGMRIGEACALQWSDIDFENNVIHITKNLELVNYDEKNKRGKFKFVLNETPKTSYSTRDIPMTERCRAAFLEQKAILELRNIKCNFTIKGYNDFVFMTRNGMPHNDRGVNSSIRTIVKHIRKTYQDYPHVSCHILRHTFATRLVENHVDYKVIQRIMGHANINITLNTYVSVNEDFKMSELSKAMQLVVPGRCTNFD